MIRRIVCAAAVLSLAAVVWARIAGDVVVAQGTATASLTFYKDVAPLLRKNCETCHR